jgi:flagellar assembly protein FliH
MTFSSEPVLLAGFVEQPLPGPRFVETPAPAERAAAAPKAAPVDPAAERARAEAAAHARGVAEGRASAEAAHAAALASACAAFDAALGALRARERAQAEALAEAGLGLAVAVAGHVLRREIAQDLDALAPALREAIATLAPETGLRLVLSRADLMTLQAGGAEALARLAEHWNAELAADATLGAGEARVEAAGAAVELVWARVLERLETALRERLAVPEQTP